MPTALDMVRVGDLARELGITAATVKRWIGTGAVRGAFRSVGGHWLVPRAEAERLIGEHQGKAN